MNQNKLTFYICKLEMSKEHQNGCLKYVSYFLDLSHYFLDLSHYFLNLSHYFLNLSHYFLNLSHYFLNLSHYFLNLSHYFLTLSHYFLNLSHYLNQQPVSIKFNETIIRDNSFRTKCIQSKLQRQQRQQRHQLIRKIIIFLPLWPNFD